MSKKPSLLKPPSMSKVPTSTPSGSKMPSISAGAGATPATSKKGKKSEKKSKKAAEFELPALSTTIVGKKQEIDFQELKKKMIRRQCPPGEDKKALAQIIKNLKCVKIRVQEFVNLVAPYTGDNGEILRKVLEEDLAAFRKLASKVYETMTQDVSDVLVNEQFQTSIFYEERCNMLNEKLLKMLSEIYDMAPDFDMEKYHRERQEHLDSIMPIPQAELRDEADVEMQRRQEMFHRLQWLRFEGVRLAEENDRLQKRLNELKRIQAIEQQRISEQQAEAESKKLELEIEEAEKVEELHKINTTLDKSMVRSEAYSRMEEDMGIRHKLVPTLEESLKKKSDSKQTSVNVKCKKRVRKVRPPWVTEVAKEIEEQTAEQAVALDKSIIDSQRRERVRSPGFSPIVNLQVPPQPPDGYPVQNMEEVNVERTLITQTQNRDGCPSRRCGPPRDTWGGFR